MNRPGTKRLKFLGRNYDVTTWAKYLAMDQDGDIHCYEKHPRMDDVQWNSSGKSKWIGTIGWQTTLEEV